MTPTVISPVDSSYSGSSRPTAMRKVTMLLTHAITGDPLVPRGKVAGHVNHADHVVVRAGPARLHLAQAVFLQRKAVYLGDGQSLAACTRLHFLPEPIRQSNCIHLIGIATRFAAGNTKGQAGVIVMKTQAVKTSNQAARQSRPVPAAPGDRSAACQPRQSAFVRLMRHPAS